MFVLYMYKSSRFNAKSKNKLVHHLITPGDSKTPDRRIKIQFEDVLTDCIHVFKEYNHIECKAVVNVGKETQFINANNEIHVEYESFYYHLEREKFSSIESFINYLYGLFAMLYPYNRLNLNVLHSDKYIRALINEYYHSGGVK